MRPGVEQLLPETEDDAVVVAGIGVLDRRELLFAHGAPRLAHQRSVEGKLRLARLPDRMDFGPQVVRAQEIVRDPQPTRGVSF